MTARQLATATGLGVLAFLGGLIAGLSVNDAGYERFLATVYGVLDLRHGWLDRVTGERRG